MRTRAWIMFSSLCAVAVVCDASALEPSPVAATPNKKSGVVWVFSQPTGLFFAKTETTVAQYRQCVNAGACARDTFDDKSTVEKCNWGHADRDSHPMNCVSWDGASAFCEWTGGRLPTEEEWYVEASNKGSRKYPWGDEGESCKLAVGGKDSNGVACAKGGTSPVCSKELGNSVSGLCDMSGNVAEWTSTKDGKGHARRGGAWADDSVGGLERSRFVSRQSDAGAGFRCVSVSP